MDVVPDGGLVDFIESLNVEEKKVDTLQVVDKEEEETDIWQDIADALNRWNNQILVRLWGWNFT